MGYLLDRDQHAEKQTVPREEDEVEDGAEFSGRTVDDAVAEAETALGRDRQELDVEIVSQGSRGVFGIGAEPARIRARIPNQAAVVDAPASNRPAPSYDLDDEESFQDLEDESSDETETEEYTPRSSVDLAEEAKDVLENLLRVMNFDAEVRVQNEENPLTLGISGENLGVLIGRRGDNLSALQFMVNLILSKNRRQWPRVVLDVENYRARREESLHALAERVAYRVQRNGRPFTLEAMPASDRRVIHLALREHSDVETYSIGEGPSRRVVIAPKRPARSAGSR